MVARDSSINDDSSIAEVEGEKKSTTPPSGIAKGVMQDLAPLSVQATAASVAKDVTVRQVAPLVLILTGATFLNVSFSSL